MLSLLGRRVDFWGVTVRLSFFHVCHNVVRIGYRSDECQTSVGHWDGVSSEYKVCDQSLEETVV
jgi:hypothetical protein